MPRTHRIPELLNQINKLSLRRHLQRNNNRRRILIDHSIDPALPIRPLNHIFTNTRPRVPINLPAADRLDRHAASHPNPVRYSLLPIPCSSGTENSRCDGYFSDP